MKRLKEFYDSYFSILVIALAFLWSAIAIMTYRAKEAPAGSIVIRIGHWQLEAAVRTAFEEAAADYRREVNPRVYVVQDAIPEGTYGSWVSTQLMGGTAPDLIEYGKGLPENIWISYLNRYFVPLTSYVNQPNPYNKGTDLEGVPLRKTYLNGLKTAYIELLQEYMMISLSQFTRRVFYNKDLFRRLTGLSEPSDNYRKFMAACDKIKSQKGPNGKPYVPIACSNFHFGMWDENVCDPPIYGLLKKGDFNRDGYMWADETFLAVTTKRLSFDDPHIRAKFQIMRELTAQFEDGFTGLTRDEAVFLFAQEKAVFMSTGTWDARSLQEQAKGKFEVGVMNFPCPGPDDPVYGPLIEGPMADRPFVGIDMAINRKCLNKDVALDFLLYLASKKGNEKFNNTVGWIPAIRGAKVPEFLRGFEPRTMGVYGSLSVPLGGETNIRWAQLYSLYQVNQITFDELVKQFQPFYIKNGLKDYMEVQKDWRRGILGDEVYLAGVRAKTMSAPPGIESDSAWVKYRGLVGGRLVYPEINHARQMDFINKGPQLTTAGPYEYSPRVIASVRANLRKGR